MAKRLLYIFLIAVFILGVCPQVQAGREYVSGDTGTLGNDDWHVDSTGDIIPDSDDSRDIGSSTYQVQNVYTDGLVLNGVTMDGTSTRIVPFSVGDFILNDGTNVWVLSTSTTPGFECDNKAASIVWADGETTPVSVSFKVPDDYSSGGAFKLFCDESTSTTHNKVDFSVYVNREGTVFDSTTSNQTPVELAGVAGTPDMVTLTVGTDFASLAAGDVVTANFWRDDNGTSTGDLEMYYAEFYYTAKVE